MKQIPLRDVILDGFWELSVVSNSLVHKRYFWLSQVEAHRHKVKLESEGLNVTMYLRDFKDE